VTYPRLNLHRGFVRCESQFDLHRIRESGEGAFDQESIDGNGGGAIEFSGQTGLH
jgi:hypothetical protein